MHYGFLIKIMFKLRLEKPNHTSFESEVLSSICPEVIVLVFEEIFSFQAQEMPGNQSDILDLLLVCLTAQPSKFSVHYMFILITTFCLMIVRAWNSE